MTQYTRSPGLALEQCRLLLRYGLEKGLTHEQCLENSKLNIEDFDTVSCEPSIEQERIVILNLCNHIKETPARIGYNIGLKVGLPSFGLIGQAMVSSASLKHALDIALRYSQEVFHFTNISYHVKNDNFDLQWEIAHAEDEALKDFYIARDFGACLTIMRSSGHNIPIKTLSISLSDETLSKEIVEELSCDVNVDSKVMSITVDEKLLHQPMPLLNAQASQTLESLCYTQIALPNTNEKMSLSEKIGQLLRQHQYILTRDDAANALCVSSRTLARHLLNEKTTWRTLVATQRIAEAKHLLSHSDDSIELISEKVGFSSSSAFSLAFRRACAKTPSEYRKHYSIKAKTKTA